MQTNTQVSSHEQTPMKRESFQENDKLHRLQSAGNFA